MAFFTDKERFTHTGRFYGVPIYLDLTNEIPTITGTNIVFDKMFSFMVLFHNYVVEPSTQLFTSSFDIEYEAGFPIWITGEIQK